MNSKAHCRRQPTHGNIGLCLGLLCTRMSLMEEILRGSDSSVAATAIAEVSNKRTQFTVLVSYGEGSPPRLAVKPLQHVSYTALGLDTRR